MSENFLTEHPVVTRHGFLDMQVCVPKDWTDEQVIKFAEGEWPCGTMNGWRIRKEGSKYLAGDREREPCSGEHGRPDFVHITLDA